RAPPALPAAAPHKLDKRPGGLIGSEFAGRHMLYERFYAGNSIIVRNQSDREAPWEKFHAIVDGLLQRIEAPRLFLPRLRPVSLRLYVGRLDDRPPFLDLGFLEGGERLR